MSFQELHARLNRQYDESKVWKLLRTKNAPLILAFRADLFKESGTGRLEQELTPKIVIGLPSQAIKLIKRLF